MRRAIDSTTLKFAAFTTVMLMVAAMLMLVFSDQRAGDTTGYGAVFTDASGLRSGDTVRIAGVRVGTVGDVSLASDNRVHVDFDVDNQIALPGDTGAAVRYLNLVGDRYLELTEGKASSTMSPGNEIPASRTDPALDLDVLLGGLKPVIDGLEPTQVNALSSAVLDIMQGQRSTVRTLFENSSTLFATLGDNVDVMDQLIDQLSRLMTTLSKDRDRFGETIDRLGSLVGELARQRDPIGAAISSLDTGTATVANLLTQARPSLSGSIDQLSRLAPALDSDKPTLEHALQRAPDNFRKLVRTGTYGNFIQYYVCAVTVRVSDPSGRVVVLPWIEQKNGRCSD
ncbi:MCE family protein [Gordonia sp. PKS22-38]|uniref:MCE family protein n=1 Tax=Gordonia prachuapensis TaxID=3115651 RepID=A0ABU7MSX6_9ACTN|nr:MCE family protein [Gordonia sp. PKS22-38]